MKHLPDSIKPLVKEMAFTLQTWDEAGPLWSRPDVTNTLCSELLNLRTIAMEVLYEDGNSDFCTEAPLHHFHALLQSKRIDTVCLFYGDGKGGGDDKEVYRHEPGPRNDAEEVEESASYQEMFGGFVGPKRREFDIVEVPSWTQWTTEPGYLERQNLARMIEITRWEDKKLGSKTYKHHFE